MEQFSKSEVVVRRVKAEIEFSEGLAELLDKPEWNKLIAEASRLFDSAIASESLADLTQAMNDIETMLAPIGKVAKEYTCHCVGHGHMDMNWMWNWPETVAGTNDMFVTVLKLMEEFPEFCFSQSQTSVYEIIRKYNPELFEQIKMRVQEGRWEITASEWVEGDKNLASGESLGRHLLYSRQFMEEHFGLKPEDISIAWNPDTFGHAHTIPMIYSRGGVSRYYMCRGGMDEKPPIFWWQGPDGSRLLVNLEHTWYNDVLGPHNVKGLLSFCKQTGMKDWMLVYGIGDHGGGPTRRDLHLHDEMDSWPIFPNFKYATTCEYYKLVEKQSDKLPVLDRELNYEFSGCYTSQSDIKKTNRLAESVLERAETAATFAYTMLEKDYPADRLQGAWTDTLLGHFHDILPGSGVKATREYHSGMFQNTAATTGMIITNSLRAIAAEVDTSFDGEAEATNDDTHFGAGMGLGDASIGGISTACHVSGGKRGFVVFNPTASMRNEVIKLTVWDAENDDVQTKTFAIRLVDGTEISAQRVGDGAAWGHRYVELVVPVTVSALGYTAFVLNEVGENEAKVKNAFGYPEKAGLSVCQGVKNLAMSKPLSGSYIGTRGMENDYIRVRFDKESGGVIELVDKKTGENLVSEDQPSALLEYILERPEGMTSWRLHPAIKRQCPLELVGFKPVTFGPHSASYEGVYKINDSTIKVIYSLNADSPELGIKIEANWLERGGPEIGIPTLRMRFPLALTNVSGRYEIPFGSIERKPDAEQEIPALRWVDVVGQSANGKQAGCTVLNDCKYGYCLDETTLTTTLIRSSYDPDPLPEYGEFEMKFAMIPHGKEIAVSDLMHAGTAFNQPLQIVGTDIHKGKFASVVGAALKTDKSNVIITGIKKAEGEESLIVRLLETAGESVVANITVDSILIGNISNAVEVDLLERELPEKNTAEVVSGGFSVKIPANAIASVKIKLVEGEQ